MNKKLSIEESILMENQKLVADYLNTTIGERIRMSRINAGFSQSELAEKLGVSSSTIESYEHEMTFPSECRCKDIARVCNVNETWLSNNNSEINSVCKNSTKPYKGSGKLK